MSVPTVVIPRCFLDGECKTDEIEVRFDQRVVKELRTALIGQFPKLDKWYTNIRGELVYWFLFVRGSDGDYVFDEETVGIVERIYLMTQIGC